MNFGYLFGRSGRITWQHKYLWLFGFLFGINGTVATIARFVLGVGIPDRWLRLETWRDWLNGTAALPTLELTPGLLGRFTLWSTVWLLVIVLGFWLVVTVAEGSIIGAVHRLESGQTTSTGGALRLGLSYLKRFIAIDAIVFFPWFVIALIMMIGVIILTFTIGYQSLTNATTQSMLTVAAIGLLCLLSLACLLVPVLMLSVLYRLLAFRDAALLNAGVRQAVRHTWVIIRRHLSSIILVTIFVWGLQLVSGRILSLFSIPLLSLTAVIRATEVMTARGVGIVAAIAFLFTLMTLLKSILYTYTATLWTLAYHELVTNYQ
jgi:hypothetical protein